MESTQIALIATLLGLILALTDFYIEKDAPGWMLKLSKIWVDLEYQPD